MSVSEAGYPRRGANDQSGGVSPLHGTVAEVPAAVLDRLAALCPLETAPDAVAAVSRDWWPLAMIWEQDGTQVTPPAAVVRPTDRRRPRRGAARLQRGAGARHRGRRPQRGVRREHAGARRRRPRPHRAHRDRGRRRHRARARRAGRYVRYSLGGHAAPRSRTSPSATGPSRSTSPPSAAGWRAGARARCRPATGRSRTWCWGSTSPSPTAGWCTPVARHAPRSGPTSPSCSWAARARSA